MWGVFFKGVKKHFTGKVSFEHRPERSEGDSHVNGYQWERQKYNKASENMLEACKRQQGGQRGQDEAKTVEHGRK